jgi:hypothetical protein
MMKSRIAGLFLPLFLLASLTPAHACADGGEGVNTSVDKVTTDLKKNDKAPYNGILITYKLAAEIKENCAPEIIEKKCNAKIDEQVGLCKSACKKETDILDAKYNALLMKHETVSREKDKYIKILESQQPSWYENYKLWFVVGLGTGVVIGGGTLIIIARNL